MKNTINTIDTELSYLNGVECNIIHTINKGDGEYMGLKYNDEVLPMYVIDIKHNDKNLVLFSDEIKEIQ